MGALLIAITSWWVGAVPNAYQVHPPGALGWFPIGGIVPRIGFYLGLTLLTTAWLLVGRDVLSAEHARSVPGLQRICLLWAAPMMVAMPVASRDLWAYAAQGHLVDRGLDPYRSAPSDVPGIFAANVSPGWIHSTAPYGPLWLGINHAIAGVYGEHVVAAVFLLRVPVLAGLVLLLWGVRRVADRVGIRADRAVWITALSPLTIELILGAGHNDLLMAGLTACGAAVALGPGRAVTTLVPAAALMALAAAVKSPAVIGVAFVLPIWLGRPTAAVEKLDLGLILRHAVSTLVTAVLAFGAVTTITGYGLGWIHQVGASARTVNWLSLPTDAAILADAVTGHARGASRLDHPMQTWRTAGLVLAGLLLVAVWLVAMGIVTGFIKVDRRPGDRPPRIRRAALPEPRDRLDRNVDARARSVSLLGLAMLAVILLGPAVQLWYLIWALPFLTALTGHRRATMAMVAVIIAMVYTVDPHGLSFTMKPAVVPIIAFGALIAWLALRDLPFGSPAGDATAAASAARHDDADGAGAGMHADGRGHL